MLPSDTRYIINQSTKPDDDGEAHGQDEKVISTAAAFACSSSCHNIESNYVPRVLIQLMPMRRM